MIQGRTKLGVVLKHSLEVSLRRPVGLRPGIPVGRKKAKECLELPAGLTELNISARWWREGKRRCIPTGWRLKCSTAPFIPGHFLLWVAKVFNCIIGGLLARNPLKENSTQLKCSFLSLMGDVISQDAVPLYCFRVKRHEDDAVLK